MANFSENQVRHLYVVDAASDFSVGGTADAMHFTFKDANGEPVRSDIIENITSAKAVGASTMARKTKVTKIALDSNVNGGNPVAGEDYVICIEYRQFIAKSDESFYHEFASAHASLGTTASALLIALATNLALNTKKQEMVKVSLYDDTNSMVIPFEVDKFSASVSYNQGAIVSHEGKTYSFDSAHSAGAWVGTDATELTVNSILIEEIPQDWILGIKEQTPVYFTVSTSTINVSSDDINWSTVTDETSALGTTITNGKTIADLEYFLMGERGDIYRKMGFPNYVPTKYLVDATKAYDVIDIHYSYVGANHSVQKSEKTITIVADSATSHAIMNTATTGVIAKINAVKAGLLSTI